MANVRLTCKQQLEGDVFGAGRVGEEVMGAVVWFGHRAEIAGSRFVVVLEDVVAGDGVVRVADVGADTRGQIAGGDRRLITGNVLRAEVLPLRRGAGETLPVWAKGDGSGERKAA